MTNSIDLAYERLLAIRSEIEAAIAAGPNESDTRLKVLDRFLSEVLEWKHEAVSTEPPTESGYDSRRHPWVHLPDSIRQLHRVRLRRLRGEDLRAAGRSLLNPACIPNALPVRRWHAWQLQIETEKGSPAT